MDAHIQRYKQIKKSLKSMGDDVETTDNIETVEYLFAEIKRLKKIIRQSSK